MGYLQIKKTTMNIIKIYHFEKMNTITISIIKNEIPILFKMSKKVFIKTLLTIENEDEIGYEFDATDPITITSVFRIKDYEFQSNK
jgi:hypothetical protein